MNFKRFTNVKTNLVKGNNGDLLVDFRNILDRWMNYFCQLLNGQTEIHMAGPLVPEPSSFEVEIAIERLKRYKLLGIDQVLA
jgi:hypothetical protein